MNLYWLIVIEKEEGKQYLRRKVIAAYDSKHAREKLRCYYEETLRSLDITYTVRALYRLMFDAGDIADVTRRMLA